MPINARALTLLLSDFLSRAPVSPLDREGKIGFKALRGVSVAIPPLLSRLDEAVSVRHPDLGKGVGVQRLLLSDDAVQI